MTRRRCLPLFELYVKAQRTMLTEDTRTILVIEAIEGAGQTGSSSHAGIERSSQGLLRRFTIYQLSAERRSLKE